MIRAEILTELEKQERFEECADLHARTKAVESGDALAYTKLAFERKGLIEVGWIHAGATWQEVHDRALQFFGYDNIFEYETGTAGTACAKYNLAVVKKQGE